MSASWRLACAEVTKHPIRYFFEMNPTVDVYFIRFRLEIYGSLSELLVRVCNRKDALGELLR